MNSQLAIRGAEVRGNMGGEGGGVYHEGGHLELEAVFFEDNVNAAGEASDVEGLGDYSSSCLGSSCVSGSYGTCVPSAGSACASCELDACSDCPSGTASAVNNSVTPDDCMPCGLGNFSAHAGSTQCDGPCAIGHYVTNDASDTDGFGVTSGGTSCNLWCVDPSTVLRLYEF